MNTHARPRWRIPLLILLLILLAAAGLFALYRAPNLLALLFSRGNHPTFVALREAVDELTGRKYRPGYVLPTSTTSQDFFGRVYIRTRSTSADPDSAATITQANALVGFPVVEPAIAGMKPVDFFNISKAGAYNVQVDLEEARRILSASPALADELPSAAQDFQVKVEIPAGVVLHQRQAERMYFLYESPPGLVHVDDSDAALYDSLQELGLRSLGLTSEEAQLVSQELGRSVFHVILPNFLTHADAAAVNGAPALLLSRSSVDPALSLLAWKANGLLYSLYGTLPPEEMLQIAESLATPE
jgi:hypothetical protein